MPRVQTYFFLLLLTAILALCFFIFLPFLNVLVLAAVFAVVLEPVRSRVALALGGSRGLAALAVTILFLLVILIPLSLLVTRLVVELHDLYLVLAQSQGGGLEWFNRAVKTAQRLAPHSSLDFASYVNQLVAWFSGRLATLVSGTFSALLKILLWVVALFFFLRDGSHFRQILIRLSPLPDTHDRHIAARLETTINAVVRGALLIALLQGTLTGLGFWIFGVPNATLWGAAAAFCALIPGVGTALVLVPGVLYLFTQATLPQALGLLAWGALLVGLIDNILASYLYSRKSAAHPMLVLFSVLGGLAFFGPVGFILGPVALSLLLALFSIYQEKLV